MGFFYFLPVPHRSYSIFNSLSWQKDEYQTDPNLIYIPLATEISILHLRFLINPVGEKEKGIIGSYTVEVFSMVTQRIASFC